MRLTDEAQGAVEFGRFRLLPHRGELRVDGVAVELGGRAFDILMVLTEARGALVTKDEIMARVWPDTVVEENNLQFQISTLRKALGEDRDFIRTVSGRGYRFVAEVTTDAPHETGRRALGESGPAIAEGRPAFGAGNLPAPASDIVGRESHLRDVTALVTANRLVTLVGAGGIGKTRLAIELARRLGPTF